MSVRMRHTRSHSGKRRSHHALETARTTACDNCGVERLPHRVCANCGVYRGRKTIDVAARAEKREKKKKKKE